MLVLEMLLLQSYTGLTHVAGAVHVQVRLVSVGYQRAVVPRVAHTYTQARKYTTRSHFRDDVGGEGVTAAAAAHNSRACFAPQATAKRQSDTEPVTTQSNRTRSLIHTHHRHRCPGSRP